MGKLLTVTLIISLTSLSGCSVLNSMDEKLAQGCSSGTNYTGAALGAIGGAVVGYFIGKGTGNTLATVGGAAAGGYAGANSNVGC